MPHKSHTAQKMKFSTKDFFGKHGRIRWKLRIWSHILKKCLVENFIFCAALSPSIVNRLAVEQGRFLKKCNKLGIASFNETEVTGFYIKITSFKLRVKLSTET